MNYRHLQYFVKVVQYGSIKRAAEQLNVSQPTVSAAIQKLEQEFGARLLDRRREGSVPTIYGRSLYDSAVTIGSVVQNVRDKIAALKDPSKRRLRVGTGPSVSIEHVAVAFAELRNEYPNVQMTHISGNSYDSFEQLLTVEDIDIALCHVPERLLPDSFDHRLISDNAIGALVASLHFSPELISIASTDIIAEFSWITPKDDEVRPPEGISLSRKVIEDGPPVASLIEDLQLIKQLTLSTKSIGFLPLHTVEAELQSGEFVELISQGAVVTRPIYALTRKTNDKMTLIEHFLEVVTQVFYAADRSAKPHRTVQLI